MQPLPMLADRWFNLCQTSGLDGRGAWTAMSEAYGEPSRAYHNLRHIGDCLGRLDEFAHLAENPAAIEFAI